MSLVQILEYTLHAAALFQVQAMENCFLHLPQCARRCPGSPAVSCVGTLTWPRALQCGAVRGNAGAIREEIETFISLSSVHLASITGPLLVQ